MIRLLSAVFSARIGSAASPAASPHDTSVSDPDPGVADAAVSDLASSLQSTRISAAAVETTSPPWEARVAEQLLCRLEDLLGRPDSRPNAQHEYETELGYMINEARRVFDSDLLPSERALQLLLEKKAGRESVRSSESRQESAQSSGSATNDAQRTGRGFLPEGRDPGSAGDPWPRSDLHSTWRGGGRHGRPRLAGPDENHAVGATSGLRTAESARLRSVPSDQQRGRSALDAENEALVQEGIDRLLQQCESTVLLIAHRLSTVMNADQIAVISGGEIVELGDHKSLVALEKWNEEEGAMKKGIYARLVDRQMKRDANVIDEEKLDVVKSASSGSLAGTGGATAAGAGAKKGGRGGGKSAGGQKNKTEIDELFDE